MGASHIEQGGTRRAEGGDAAAPRRARSGPPCSAVARPACAAGAVPAACGARGAPASAPRAGPAGAPQGGPGRGSPPPAGCAWAYRRRPGGGRSDRRGLALAGAAAPRWSVWASSRRWPCVGWSGAVAQARRSRLALRASGPPGVCGRPPVRRSVLARARRGRLSWAAQRGPGGGGRQGAGSRPRGTGTARHHGCPACVRQGGRGPVSRAVWACPRDLSRP